MPTKIEAATGASTPTAVPAEDFWWQRGMREILFRVLDPLVFGRDVHRVLEGGCGPGAFSHILNARYEWTVFPVDGNFSDLAAGRDRGVERSSQAETTALPFPAEYFEAVFYLDKLALFRRGEEAAALEELTRVLAPGGLIVLRVPALDIFRNRHWEHVGEKQRFTRARLISAVEPHGIRVLRCSYINSILSPLALAKFRLTEPIFWKPPEATTLPSGIDNMLYMPLLWESYWLRAGLNLPFGQNLLLIGEKPIPELSGLA